MSEKVISIKSINDVEKWKMYKFNIDFYDVMFKVVVLLGILGGLFVLVKFVIGKVEIIIVIKMWKILVWGF